MTLGHPVFSPQGGGIRIDGSADLTACNIHDNAASSGGGLYIFQFDTTSDSSTTLTNTNVYENEGGGVHVQGVANFEGCNIHDNIADNGGGLAVYGGMATLTNTNVYSNQAQYVCSPFQLSLNFHPSPP